MERGKYSRTRQGQASRMLKRHLRRFMLTIDQQPQSKNIRAMDAVAFQQAIVGQLQARKQSAYTGPVFLQMEFFTMSKTPPAIYRLPKNYLNLMERPRADSAIDHKPLLYRNDRQVKALIVRYHLDGPFEEPQVWVRAEPFRDSLADIELVDHVSKDDFEDDEDGLRSYECENFREGPFHREESWDDDDFQRLTEFEREKESYLRVLGNDGYEAQRHMMRMQAQQQHLRRTDQFTCRGLLGVFQNHWKTKGLPHDNMMTRLAALTRSMTLSEPFVLELHHAPHRKPKDLGVVRIDGRDQYLGKYNSPESWEKYQRMIAEWLGSSQRSARSSAPSHDVGVDLSINEMVLAYWDFAKTYYSKDGRPTKELSCMQEALRPLRQLYGHTSAQDFGPKALKTVRQHMIDQSLARGLINHRVGRIKRVFKWAVAEELIPPTVHHGLQAVAGLRYGRTKARETAPIKPVDDVWVDSVLPYVSP